MAKKRLNVRWWVLAVLLSGIFVGGQALSHLTGPGSKLPAMVWTGIAVIGVALGAQVTVHAYHDLHATAKNGMSLVYSRALIRREIVKMTQLVTMLAVGIIALLPSPPVWSRGTIAAGLIYVAGALVLNTAFDSTLRERMRKAEEGR